MPLARWASPWVVAEVYDLPVAKLTEAGLRSAIPELWVYAIHRRWKGF